MDLLHVSDQIKGDSPDKMITVLCNISRQVIFTTSFGIEDQVITDIIFKNNLPVKVHYT